MFKWSKDFGEASFKFEQAAKVYKEIGYNKEATEAYLNFAKCSEESKEYTGSADGYAEAARLLPISQWKTSL